MVELAVVLPVLIIILFGIVSFGQLYHAKITAVSAAHAAARKAATSGSFAVAKTDGGAAAKTVLNNAIGITNPKATISAPSGWGKGKLLTCKVSVDVNLIMPLPLNGSWGTKKTITDTVVMRIEK